MGPAARGAGQVGRDRLDQPGVGVGGDQHNAVGAAGQAAGDQVGEERIPRRGGLTGGDLDPEHLAVAIGVHPGGDQHHRVDHPVVVADLHRQRVRGHERERPRLGQRAGGQRGDLLVEVGGHPGDLRLRQRGDPQGLDQLVHAVGRDAEQVAGRHHRDQRSLRALAALEQPLGEVGPLAELGDRHVEGADPVSSSRCR